MFSPVPGIWVDVGDCVSKCKAKFERLSVLVAEDPFLGPALNNVQVSCGPNDRPFAPLFCFCLKVV